MNLAILRVSMAQACLSNYVGKTQWVGCRFVSLTFISEALTAFTIWPPELIDGLSVTGSSVAELHQ
jgi:hypothetical protein